MHKNVQTEPRKITKIDITLLLFYVDTSKILKAIRANGYRFVPKGWIFPTETIRLVVRSSGLWEAYTQTCPQMGQFFYHGMLMLLHDRMISFMNFRWLLDLLEFKTRYLNVCGLVTVAGCVKFITISFMGPKHATKDTFDFSTSLYALEICM